MCRVFPVKDLSAAFFNKTFPGGRRLQGFLPANHGPLHLREEFKSLVKNGGESPTGIELGLLEETMYTLGIIWRNNDGIIVIVIIIGTTPVE